MAASLAISACWHLLALAVLALAVHPFELPLQSPAIELQILPPQPDEAVVLRPRIQPDTETVPAQPEPPRPPTPPQTAQPVPPQPLETVAPPVPALAKPPQAERRPAPATPNTTDIARLPELTPTPEPLAETHAVPSALAKPPELDRPPAPPRRPLSVAVPNVELQAPAEAEAAPPAQTHVLTNQQVVPGPIEIRPRERAAPLQTTQSGAEGAPPAGGPGSTGGALATGGSGGGALPKPNAAAGVLGGYDYKGARGGLSMRLGCATPDTYHLTPEERAACLQRFGAGARGAADLGPNIPADKQAEYDRQVACRNAYTRQSTPGSASASTGASIAGLGYNPSLKACRPGDR